MSPTMCRFHAATLVIALMWRPSGEGTQPGDLVFTISDPTSGGLPGASSSQFNSVSAKKVDKKVLDDRITSELPTPIVEQDQKITEQNPTAIVACGATGSGKSRIENELARQYSRREKERKNKYSADCSIREGERSETTQNTVLINDSKYEYISNTNKYTEK
jgi:hypothetical protein